MIDEPVLRAAGVAASLALGARWLRVAQREHYLGGRCAATWRLWLATSRPDTGTAALAAAGVVAGTATGTPALTGAAALLGAVTPLRLPHRGRTGKLAWTPRLRRVAAVAAVVQVPVVLVAPLPVAAVAVAAPFLAVDLALYALAPVEQRMAKKFLDQAQRKLRAVAPQVVAITGSYGKTTTKNHLAHLLQGTTSVVPSPASFNNAMGLSRAVNEHLVPGTDVFIAEMGTYGKGEIRRLCDLFPPDVSVITAIGEVHLERMKTLDTILEAKAEITEQARTAVLNVDDERLAGLADRLAAQGKTVVRYSTEGADADVQLTRDGDARVLVVRGEQLGRVTLPASAHAGGAAAAVAAAVALGTPTSGLVARLQTLPSVAHRMEPQRTDDGGWVLDDTYNSNPVGAASAVRRGAELAAETGGSLHLVTPGMVEMGPVQVERNAELARVAAHAGAATLVVVGRTNRDALVRGAAGSATTVVERPDRASAVAAVSERTGPGDVVVFENDLPDHYP